MEAERKWKRIPERHRKEKQVDLRFVFLESISWKMTLVRRMIHKHYYFLSVLIIFKYLRQMLRYG